MTQTIPTRVLPECFIDKVIEVIDIDGSTPYNQNYFSYTSDPSSGTVTLALTELAIDAVSEIGVRGVIVKVKDTVTNAAREAHVIVNIQQPSTVKCPPLMDFTQSIDLVYNLGASDLTYVLNTGIEPECLYNKQIEILDMDGVSVVDPAYFVEASDTAAGTITLTFNSLAVDALTEIGTRGVNVRITDTDAGTVRATLIRVDVR